MIGAICGDFIGSVFEHDNVKTKEFDLFSRRSRFTDDTVLTIATMDALLADLDFTRAYKRWYQHYPHAGYGGSFIEWAASDNMAPYNSWGNGSAMRVSPVALFYNTLEDVLNMAEASARVTHNHPEGIKGAQATAACIYLARVGKSKEEIKAFVEDKFGYKLRFTLNDIRPAYRFDVSCQGSVPEAIVAFLESTDYEDAIRNAISIGGDSDTIAAITGGIAEGYYKEIPYYIQDEALKDLPREFQIMIEDFYVVCNRREKQAEIGP